MSKKINGLFKVTVWLMEKWLKNNNLQAEESVNIDFSVAPAEECVCLSFPSDAHIEPGTSASGPWDGQQYLVCVFSECVCVCVLLLAVCVLCADQNISVSSACCGGCQGQILIRWSKLVTQGVWNQTDGPQERRDTVLWMYICHRHDWWRHI